jgi:DNA end-binding protein Ku
MARAIWKGSISFGLVNIPVALFSAENRSEELSFHMLDRRDMAPVGYKRINKRTGDDVPWDEIVKGYEYEDGSYVVVTDEDFIRANVEATRTVEIVDFVEGKEIDPAFYEKPYYLAPANKAANKGYALLRETLRRTGKVGIAKVVIRTREYLAALISHGPVMLLDLMRYGYEVREAAEVEVPAEDLKKLGVTDKELQLAETLVDQMVTEWDPNKYKDSYREDVLALIRKKVEAGETRVVEEVPHPEEEEVPGVVDIMSLLKKSVAERGKAAPPARGRKAAGGGSGGKGRGQRKTA